MWLTASYPIFYHSAHLTIYTHGVFFGLGAVVGLLILKRLARLAGLEDQKVLPSGVLIFLAGLVSARLGYFLTYPSQFFTPAQVLEIWQGGLVSYWGIVGGGLVAWKLLGGQQRGEWLDRLAVAVLYAWAIGRLGNFFAGDSVGVVWRWPWFYGRVPIQLLESAWCLVLAVGFTYSLNSVLKPGRVFLYSLSSYLVGRLLIDSWRDEGVWWGLHISQYASLLFLVIIGVVGWVQKKNDRR